MTMSTNNPLPPSLAEGIKVLRAKWGWIVALGVVFLIAGFIALGSAVAATASAVMIVGKMTMREWEKDGVKRESWELRAETLQMLGGRPDGQTSAPASRPAAAPAPAAPSGGGNGFNDFSDDCPF